MIALNQHVSDCHAGIPKTRNPRRQVFALPVLPPNQTPAKPIIPNQNSGPGTATMSRSQAGAQAANDDMRHISHLNLDDAFGALQVTKFNFQLPMLLFF
jgi:hypothetical protein